MELEEIIEKLEEAIELNDWEIVEESIIMIRELSIGNPIDDYEDEW